MNEPLKIGFTPGDTPLAIAARFLNVLDEALPLGFEAERPGLLKPLVEWLVMSACAETAVSLGETCVLLKVPLWFVGFVARILTEIQIAQPDGAKIVQPDGATLQLPLPFWLTGAGDGFLPDMTLGEALEALKEDSRERRWQTFNLAERAIRSQAGDVIGNAERSRPGYDAVKRAILHFTRTKAHRGHSDTAALLTQTVGEFGANVAAVRDDLAFRGMVGRAFLMVGQLGADKTSDEKLDAMLARKGTSFEQLVDEFLDREFFDRELDEIS